MKFLLLFIIFISGCAGMLPDKEEEKETAKTETTSQGVTTEILEPTDVLSDKSKKAVKEEVKIEDFEIIKPQRHWKVTISWEPDPTNDNKAFILKTFLITINGQDEMIRFDNALSILGGEQAYYDWLELNMHPLAVLDKRVFAETYRTKEDVRVKMQFRSSASVLKATELSSESFLFPDPLFDELIKGCVPASREFVPENQTVLVEIVLASRAVKPKATSWSTVGFQNDKMTWLIWSETAEKQIAYKQYFKTRIRFSRCPLPPELNLLSKYLGETQEMSITW